MFFFGQKVSHNNRIGHVVGIGNIGLMYKVGERDPEQLAGHNVYDALFDEVQDAEYDRLLLIHRGLPGAGKSTAADKVVQYGKENGLVVCHHEADHYHIQPDGSYDWKPENMGKAHEQCRTLADESLQVVKANKGIVIVSNTSTTLKEMKPYIALADLYGIPYRVVTFGTQLTLSDLENRNVHNVPMSSLERMKARWQPFDGEIVVS